MTARLSCQEMADILVNTLYLKRRASLCKLYSFDRHEPILITYKQHQLTSEQTKYRRKLRKQDKVLIKRLYELLRCTESDLDSCAATKIRPLPPHRRGSSNPIPSPQKIVPSLPLYRSQNTFNEYVSVIIPEHRSWYVLLCPAPVR